MIALIIILLIVFFIFFLMFLPITLKIIYSSGGYIEIKYFFLSYKISLQDWQKTEIKKRTNSKTKKEDNYLKKLVKKQGLVNTVTQLINIFKMLFTRIFELFGKIDIQHLNLTICVGQGDAAETGIVYGTVNAVACTALGIINGLFNVQNQKLNIDADFKKEILIIDLNALFKIKIYKVVKVAFNLLLELSKNKLTGKI